MKKLLAALATTALLAGCGTQSALVATATPGVQAQARLEKGTTIFYGDWVEGRVVAIKQVEAASEERAQRAHRELTLEIRTPSKVAGATGRLVVAHWSEEPLRVRKGDVVAGFVNYPKVDMDARRFVKDQVVWSLDLKVVAGR